MSIFGHDPNDVTDPMLIQAMRKRLMDEITERRAEKAAGIVNNVYGGGGGGGIGEQMAGKDHHENPDDLAYFVDILRENHKPGDSVETVDPETGRKIKRVLEQGGWHKSVHRFASKKKAE